MDPAVSFCCVWGMMTAGLAVPSQTVAMDHFGSAPTRRSRAVGTRCLGAPQQKWWETNWIVSAYF